MHSKLNVQATLRSIEPIRLSLSLHFGLSAFILFVVFYKPAQKELINFDVFTAPSQNVAAKALQNPVMPKPAQSKKRGVFGLTKKAITTDSLEGETIKAGNTIAKEVDQKKLSDKDQESLPIPADEIMVSEMPTLADEVRIPYPPEAKKAGIQGAVVMDILIDSLGRVREAILVSGPGFGLNEAALAAVKQFQFRPARIQEQAVAVRIRYAYRFILER